MKIFFYINCLEKGGAERVIIQLSKQFHEKGNVVKLITSFTSEEEYELPSDLERVSLFSQQLVGNRIRRNYLLIKKLRVLCKRERPDILVSFMQEPNFRSIIATLGLKTKSLISVRNDPEMEYSGKAGHLIAKFILPIANGCVFQTYAAREWFPEKLRKKSKIIFNQVSQDFFSIRHIPSNEIVVIGRLAEQKNPVLAINAFSLIHNEFPEYILNIYGKGPLKELLENRIHELKLEEYINLMGTTNKVPEVLGKSSVYILCSNYEGLPNALMEAQAVGIACIATNCPCGGPESIIENDVNGILVGVGNQEELYMAMKRVLSDNLYRERLEYNAKIMAKRFEPDIVFNQWNDYIESLINTK